MNEAGGWIPAGSEMGVCVSYFTRFDWTQLKPSGGKFHFGLAPFDVFVCLFLYLFLYLFVCFFVCLFGNGNVLDDFNWIIIQIMSFHCWLSFSPLTGRMQSVRIIPQCFHGLVVCIPFKSLNRFDLNLKSWFGWLGWIQSSQFGGFLEGFLAGFLAGFFNICWIDYWSADRSCWISTGFYFGWWTSVHDEKKKWNK